jgi:RecA-family ATPase
MAIPFEEAVTWIEDPLPPGDQELIPGLLPKRGQLMIAGETEIGKSLVALEMAASLLTGKPLWGKLPCTQVGRVLYVLGEHHPDVIQKLWVKTGLNVPPHSLALVGPDKFKDHFLVMNGQRQHQAMYQLQQWVKGSDVVIFDPLAAFIGGVDAENDNVQMRLLVDTMTLVTHDQGAACTVLAHSGKPMYVNGQIVPRAKYAIRGASGTEDAATNVFYMERLSQEQDDEYLFRLRKRKYKGEAPDFYYLMRDENNLVHTQLDGKRPRVEAKRLQFRDQLRRLQLEMPHETMSKCVELLAKINGISRATAFRQLSDDTENIDESS